jgi:predicted ArsR family transcriptional regulator
MMSSRRQDVLAVLRGAGDPLSINAVADELGIHPNTVRFHLEALLSTGQVESVETDRVKPGRPALMFRAVEGMDPAGPRDYRMLAGILADALAGQPDPAQRAVAAGRAWTKHRSDIVTSREPAESVDRMIDLLAELGFEPEKRSSMTGAEEIGLRNCPFLELAKTRSDVVCAAHLGLMQGAMSAWDAPITVDALTPFAEPDLCVAHLAARGRA